MRLAGARRFERSRFCPCYFGFDENFKFSAFVGLGGNIGNSARRFDRFIRALSNDRRFHIVECSPILINAAFGYEAQADFSNAVINLQTSLGSNVLLKILQHYERNLSACEALKMRPGRLIWIFCILAGLQERVRG